MPVKLPDTLVTSRWLEGWGIDLQAWPREMKGPRQSPGTPTGEFPDPQEAEGALLVPALLRDSCGRLAAQEAPGRAEALPGPADSQARQLNLTGDE